MNEFNLVLLFALLVLIPGGFFIYSFFAPRKLALIPAGEIQTGHETEPLPTSSAIIEKSGARRRSQEQKVQTLTPLEERMFRAGFFLESSRKYYKIAQFICPILCAGIVAFCMSYFTLNTIIFGGILGFFIGCLLPSWYLERTIQKRDEEIMFFLPLVIEQIVIGVGSGLDVGPCIHRVVSVADERDTHNPVTELLKHVQQLTRSGTSLDEALEEIGILAGHTELKHSFMTMGQVSRHGGEISKQLQELANAVASQRETMIEGRIKQLELKATGPVVLVFVSFMSVLFAGIGLQVMKAFS